MKSWLLLRSPPVLIRFYAEGTSAERIASRTEILVQLRRTSHYEQRLETAEIIGSNLG